MLFSKRSKTINKKVKVIAKTSSVSSNPFFTKIELQQVLRTTYYFLFIPIFTIDKKD